MAVYIVTWNLNQEKPNYSAARNAFIRLLDTYDTIRDAGLESVRFVSTPQSARNVADFLHQALDNDDKIFVSRINSAQYWGMLSKDIWDWIAARL